MCKQCVDALHQVGFSLGRPLVGLRDLKRVMYEFEDRQLDRWIRAWQTLGLAERELRAYVELASRFPKGYPATTVGNFAGLHRQNATMALEKLCEKSLAYYRFHPRAKHYFAHPPSAVNQYLAGRLNELKTSVDACQEVFDLFPEDALSEKIQKLQFFPTEEQSIEQTSRDLEAIPGSARLVAVLPVYRYQLMTKTRVVR